MTTEAAVRGIRKIDTVGSIGILGSEPHMPYDRPPLSKALWKGAPLEKVWRTQPEQNVDAHVSTTAMSIDARNKRIVDDKGKSYGYEKLLLATGGTVRRLPFDVEGIIYFRTLDDYHALRKLTEAGEKFAVIGGGFIGSEIAAALAMNNRSVSMIFPGDSIGDRVYPPGLSRFLNSYYQSKGVDVLANETVVNVERKDSMYVVAAKSGKRLAVDGVVAGIGIQPNVALAQSIGVTIDNGIVVDEFLRTSLPDIYAAGDVANFFNPALGKRIRVEHEDNANTMGNVAGQNMVGNAIPYHHLPFFYSDLFDLGYEAVGELDSRLETVEDWKEEFKEGVVYYLENERVRGVLLWNTWGQAENARRLIAEKGPFNAKNVKGLLPS